MAGEWAGWPTDWLVQRILAMRDKPDIAVIGTNRFMPDEWPEIQAALS